MIMIFLFLLFSTSISLAGTPPVLLAKDNGLTLMDKDNPIERHIKTIEAKFGIKISEEFVKGIIYLPADNQEAIGFDIEAELDNPLIASYLDCDLERFPIQERNYFKEEIKRLRAHAKKHTAGDKINLISYAYAISLYRQIFLPERELEDQYFDLENNKIEDTPERTLFHEALHLWENKDSMNLAQVQAFLKAPGGYHSRIKQAEKECPNFNDYENFAANKGLYCGFKTISELRKHLAKKYKIPQRYGQGVQKAQISGDLKSCETWNTRKINQDGKKFCLMPVSKDYAADEDIHAFRKDQPSEYFAIMMEIYFYNPIEFNRVASPQEKEALEKIIKKLVSVR